MQLDKDNDGQIIAYTGVYASGQPIPPALALTLVREFADSIARETARETTLSDVRDMQRVERERDVARGARDVLSVECGTLGRERDDARASLRAMTAERDFLIVMRDRARMERAKASDALRALLHAVESNSFPARYDDAVRYAREVLGR